MFRPVILSGGAGTRMWPLSRALRPKPLLTLLGTETMLQLTATRFHGRPAVADPVIVAHESHAAEIARQLADCGVEPALTILEPLPRNTAAAIALAALAADPGELLLVMPSDHMIGRPDILYEVVRAACPFAQQDWIVTFGITPTAPQTGYGYIRIGAELGRGVHRADLFEEKPSREKADVFLSAGGYYWNAGIFLFRAGAMLEALRRHEPTVLDAAARAMDGAVREDLHLRPAPEAFARAPPISIDNAVIERAERVAVGPVDADWSDVGSWDGLYQLKPKDKEGNATAGEVVLSEVSGSLVISDSLTVAALGVEDLVIVATEDAVLILPRDRSEEVKVLVEELNQRRTQAAGQGAKMSRVSPPG